LKQMHSTRSTAMTGEQMARILDTRQRRLAQRRQTINRRHIRRVNSAVELRAAEGRWS